jgi:mono/diheme cytochrome c family protein
MKKFFFFLLLFIIVAGIAGFSYLKFVLPDTGHAPDLKITATSARIARGKYLANHVMLCLDCHSARNANFFSAPLIPGTEGKGGKKFDQSDGLPGCYIAPNITPMHLSSWSDGEIYRTLTTGVNKNGKALFPLMPYLSYGKLDQEDILSVIAYIRTLKPINNDVPASKSDFPMNLIINTLPHQANLKPKPAKSDSVAYGAYLVTAAACADCHTPQEKGKAITGMTFAGGMKFNFPGMVIQSPNITPDKETGIGRWTEQQFVDKFKAYDLSKHQPIKLNKNDMQTEMPWTLFAGMDTTDLKSIYQYLRTVKPVTHQTQRMVVNKAN